MGQYNHQTKVGNQGDLIKHFALLYATGFIRHRLDRPFIYAEMHAGRSQYQLDPDQLSDGWSGGVGRFYREHREVIGNENVYVPRNLKKGLTEYLSVIDSAHQGQKITYPGSSMIVRTMLDKKGVAYEAILFDIDPAVCHELELQTDVTVRCEDGYEGVKQIPEIDLVFIDPPDLKPHPEGHAAKYKHIAYHCLNNKIDFVSWNPLYGDPDTGKPTFECGIVRELARVQKLGFIEVRWAGWSEKMCGCQMLFNTHAAVDIATGVKRFAQMMGWEARS